LILKIISFYFFLNFVIGGKSNPVISIIKIIITSLIDTKIWEERVVFDSTKDKSLIYGNAIALRSWINLKEHAKNLKYVISNWLSENGIADNNFREDFKNPG
jgi:hypothetical protein